MSITKLSSEISDKTGLSEKDVKSVLSEGFEEIKRLIDDGEKITIKSFGTFSLKETPEREGRNPATGETMTFAASRRIAFKASKTALESA